MNIDDLHECAIYELEEQGRIMRALANKMAAWDSEHERNTDIEALLERADSCESVALLLRNKHMIGGKRVNGTDRTA